MLQALMIEACCWTISKPRFSSPPPYHAKTEVPVLGDGEGNEEIASAYMRTLLTPGFIPTCVIGH